MYIYLRLILNEKSMYEKILQKLMASRGQNSNVSEKSIKDLATMLTVTITTDEILETVEFAPFIQSLDGNINSYTANAVKTQLAEAEKKAAGTKKPAEQKTGPGEETPEWAKALIDQNAAMQKRLNEMESEKKATSRNGKLEEILKGSPDYYKKPILTGFQKMTFETEEAFEEYVETLKTQRSEFEQAAKEQGLNTIFPGSDIEKPSDDGQTAELGEAIKLLNSQKQN